MKHGIIYILVFLTVSIHEIMPSKNSWDAKSGTANIINVEEYINTETGEMFRPYSPVLTIFE